MTTELTLDRPVVFHFRLGKGTETQPKAGATVVFLPEKKQFGLALCCGKDRYCRKWGRKIADVRARRTPRSAPIRNKRFESSLLYSGPLEMKSIRESAKALAYFAAGRVDNPLVSGSFFVGEEEQAALAKVGIGRACPRDLD